MVQTVFKRCAATKTDSAANWFPARRDTAGGCKLPLGGGEGGKNAEEKVEDHKWKATVSLADANEISLGGVCYHN